MKTYTVHAIRRGRWWLLTVPEVPGAVSRVNSLDDAEDHVGEAIAFVTETSSDGFAL